MTEPAVAAPAAPARRRPGRRHLVALLALIAAAGAAAHALGGWVLIAAAAVLAVLALAFLAVRGRRFLRPRTPRGVRSWRGLRGQPSYRRPSYRRRSGGQGRPGGHGSWRPRPWRRGRNPASGTGIRQRRPAVNGKLRRLGHRGAGSAGPGQPARRGLRARLRARGSTGAPGRPGAARKPGRLRRPGPVRRAVRRATGRPPRPVRASPGAAARVRSPLTASRPRRTVQARRAIRRRRLRHIRASARRPWRLVRTRRKRVPAVVRPVPLKPVTPPPPAAPRAITAGPARMGRPGLRLIASEGRRVHRPIRRGAGVMFTQHIAEAVSTDIAGAVEHLDGPETTDAYFAAQADNIGAMGSAYGAAAEALSEKHIHPAVVDAFREIAAALGSVEDQARQAYHTHKAEHRPFTEG